ncbi:MBL fold metallo-hydrolase [Solirubrobacter phytolaccae]|uniref:MBL fold metallo-hydrolase n=1 Tax=Solirubrobacter phytolaccae TaxID=1404360 RepID=A0A9X3SC55_9ACTN|nr:MBL fold metallo-hydrolase [Solirubrobacter phytolaccae]MDA0182120.1 MBL fold metallo-hydrolase [Solirubrobacter phytolaccae]
MPEAEPTQLAPGVHRLGNEYVNCYLLEEGNELTLVDGGFPAFRHQLEDYLQSRGRRTSDITAVILTHAHSDHVGMVEGVRRDAPATVHVHADDAEMAKTGKSHPREGSILPYLRYPALYKLFLVAGKSGGARTPDIEAVTTFDGEIDLDVPGRPRVIPTPGHSPGHVAFHLPEHGVLIAGDALCTYNPLTGKRGPQLMPKAFAADARQATASLEALERIDATLTLFGHGEPWTDSPKVAVEQARERGLT